MTFTVRSSAAMVGAALASALLSGTVLAADLPNRKAPLIAPPAFSWTGAYLGVSAGIDFINNKWTTTDLTGLGLAPDNTASRNINSSAFRLGVYGGYNVQFNSTVVGVEADIAGDFGGRNNSVGIPGTLTAIATLPSTDRVSSRGDFDGSVRGRLGYLFTPTMMFYGTAGVAFQGLKTSVNCPAGGANSSYCNLPDSTSHNETRVGFTVGGGIEGRIFDNWIGRLEYRYSGFGSKSHGYLGHDLFGFDAITARTRLNTQQVTVGIAYKF